MSASDETGTRFSPITDDDKAGILWIASLLAGTYAALFILVRMYIKRKCFGQDDWICSAATIVGAGSFVATYVSLSLGVGKTSMRIPDQLQGIGQAVFASRITLVFAVSLAKCSVTFLIKRLFSQDMAHHRTLCDILLATIALWTLGAVVGVSIDCAPQGLVINDGAACSRQFLRWLVIGAFDAFTELLIVVLSCGLVWRLQMRLDLKLRVILAFLFRLPLVALATIHIYYIHATPSTNLNLNIIPALTIEQIQLGYALVSATIPNLKSFIMSFDTAMMMDFTYKIDSNSKTRASYVRKSRREVSIPVKSDHHSSGSAQNKKVGPLRPEQLEHEANIHHIHELEARAGLIPAGERRDPPKGTIRRDMHWKVEETFASRSNPEHQRYC